MAGATPNTEAALDFLERWRPGGPWVLTAIATDKKSIETATFSERAGASAWIASRNGQRNLYFHVNPTFRPLTKKAMKEDVAALAWLHVDVDPRAGEDLEQERVRALRVLREPPRGLPKPTVIVFSGGGYQGFWRLREPVALDGTVAKAEDAERWNRQLEMEFGGDNCFNVDRIMRLPGTINLPDPVKLKKGRTAALAELVEWDDERTYDIGDFRPAPKVQDEQGASGFAATAQVKVGGNVRRLGSVDELNEWNVPDRLKVIIVQGRHPDEVKEGDNSRSAWLFDVCCNLVRLGVPDETIYAVLMDPDFGVSESVLDKGSAEKCRRYALRQISQAKEHAIDPNLARMNGRFAVIRSIGGKCRVVEEQPDANLQGRYRLTMQSFNDFRNAWLNARVREGEDAKGNPRMVPLGEWWLRHEHRRTFDRIVFSPTREIADAYNLWRGFAFEPRAGSCEKFLAHARDNICGGSEEYYRYLLGWMARAVQKPDSPGEVAVVLRGGRGTGKGFFVRHFGKLFGRHFLPISDPKHLVGSFNAHLRDVVLLFADEAFYAGDKKHESILKTLITEETINIEAKGVDVETFANYLHLVLVSNEQWVVPTGANERRFFVLDVGDGRQQDRAYFAELAAELDAGGYEALLHYLLAYDLSEFRVQQVPKTSALHDQRVLSHTPEEEWWYRKLLEGQIFPGIEWPEAVLKTKLLEEYIRHSRDFNVTRRTNPTFLAKFLKRVCPAITSFQGRNGDRRPYFYGLPSLADSRAAWCALYGAEEWPTVVEREVAEMPPESEPF